jgi:hypothetical protein
MKWTLKKTHATLKPTNAITDVIRCSSTGFILALMLKLLYVRKQCTTRDIRDLEAEYLVVKTHMGSAGKISNIFNFGINLR